MTEKIIGCVYKVANTLGQGFLEKVYGNALAHELSQAGLRVVQQQPIQARYDGVVAGNFAADILVENELIVDLRAVKALDDVHMAQCINYLKAPGKGVCLLRNFGCPRIEVKWIIL